MSFQSCQQVKQSSKTNVQKFVKSAYSPAADRLGYWHVDISFRCDKCQSQCVSRHCWSHWPKTALSAVMTHSALMCLQTGRPWTATQFVFLLCLRDVKPFEFNVKSTDGKDQKSVSTEMELPHILKLCLKQRVHVTPLLQISSCVTLKLIPGDLLGY